jgi:type VI protein secretion system component Hcp
MSQTIFLKSSDLEFQSKACSFDHMMDIENVGKFGKQIIRGAEKFSFTKRKDPASAKLFNAFFENQSFDLVFKFESDREEERAEIILSGAKIESISEFSPTDCLEKNKGYGFMEAYDIAAEKVAWKFAGGAELSMPIE